MLLILFSIAVLILLTVSSVTYLCFWLNARGTGHWDSLVRLGGGHPWAIVARGFCSSLLAQATATVLHPITLAKPLWLTPGGKARPGSRPPVLFVHGYTHSASAWVLFANWFRKAGYTDLHATTYNSWTMDFEGIVAHVEREAAAILDARPGSRIILVGHSLGGLAIRQLLNTSPLRSRVLAVATLGSPHKGTTLSRLAMNRLGRSLAYKGPLIRRIEAADATPPGSLPGRVFAGGQHGHAPGRPAHRGQGLALRAHSPRVPRGPALPPAHSASGAGVHRRRRGRRRRAQGA